MLTLIENGKVYSPEPRGLQTVLLIGDKVARIGQVNRRAVEGLDLELHVIDTANCIVTPGFIDAHEHLLGGSGENGFSTQTPELYLREIVTAGITTVVGCLGVDTTMKTMPGLLAKAKAFKEEGLTAFIYSGGYNVPPTTITQSIRDDILFIDEIIGAGEVAISDERSMDPHPRELAKLVNDAHIGGMLSRKAGVTHFHVGEGDRRLAPLRTLIDDYSVQPGWLYPTHVERSQRLMEEAIALTKLGCVVDVDTVEGKLAEHFVAYLRGGGDPGRLTASSDASLSSPSTLYEQVRGCLSGHQFPLEQVLALVTSNTADVLKLEAKGRLEPGKDADVLVLRQDSFEIRDVIAKGQRRVRNGELMASESFLENSNRRITVLGKKAR